MRKQNPQIRWHLSNTEIQEIAALRKQGCSQTEIGKRLKITRNSVAHALKSLGLPTLRPLCHQEKILALLNEGVERRTIAKSLGVPYRSVYKFARENGFARPRKELSKGQLDNLRDDILNHRGSALQLTRKYRASYKFILQLAHSTLACERFLPVWKNPLSSYFPQRNYPKRKAAS